MQEVHDVQLLITVDIVQSECNDVESIVNVFTFQQKELLDE